MKIFCVIDNYKGGGSAEEKENREPLQWYLLPDSTVVRSENPMFVPDFSTRFVAYPSLVVRIEKIGKNISPKFSHRYYKSVAPGLAVMAPDILAGLRAKGLPWSRAILFDRCCMLGEFTELQDAEAPVPSFTFESDDNKIEWKVDKLRMGIDTVISELSMENTLKIGDLIFVGLGNDGLEMKIGETISAETEGERRLNIRLR